VLEYIVEKLIEKGTRPNSTFSRAVGGGAVDKGVVQVEDEELFVVGIVGEVGFSEGKIVFGGLGDREYRFAF